MLLIYVPVHVCWEFKYSLRFTVCFLNNTLTSCPEFHKVIPKHKGQRHTILVIYSPLPLISMYCTLMNLRLLQTNKKPQLKC